jgi:hypothetical protein
MVPTRDAKNSDDYLWFMYMYLSEVQH